MFWERQEGGLCRKHSLNAYVGHPEVSTSDFGTYCKQYNDHIRGKYGIEIEVGSNDYVFSNDVGLITFIIKKKVGTYCFHFPINCIEKSKSIMGIGPLEDFMSENDFIFCYNHDHVWGCRRSDDGRWNKLDSMSGISHVSLRDLATSKNLGLMIPRDKRHWDKDYFTVTGAIRKYIADSGGDSRSLCSIRNVVIVKWNTHLLGELEPLVGLLMDILSTAHPAHGMIEIYHSFLRFFETHKVDSDFSCSWFPLIVDRLLNSEHGRL